MSMFLTRRLLSMIPVLLLVSIVVFGLLHITPGDPVEGILGDRISPELADALRRELGLDQPLQIQYLRWVGNLVQGDLGRSIRSKEPVFEALLQRLPVTLQLALLSMTFAALIGVPAGIISATRRGTKLDSLATIASLAGAALPNFWLGIMLILLFSLELRLLPPSGYVPLFQDPIANLKLLILPAIALGTQQAAVIVRMTRSSLLEVLSQEFVRTARAKGLREATVVNGHALKNALIPVITMIGLQVGNLLNGSVVTEYIFAVPGIGRFVVEALYGRDYPVVQGVVFFMALVYLLCSLLVDLVYTVVDPRIRYS